MRMSSLIYYGGIVIMFLGIPFSLLVGMQDPNLGMLSGSFFLLLGAVVGSVGKYLKGRGI